MTFRTRLLFAFVLLGVVPLAGLGVGIRSLVVERLTAQFEERVTALSGLVQDDLQREGAAVARRLASLRAAIERDNRLRHAVLGESSERPYLLDFGHDAMELAGLSMLQIQDESGRILSSGHFRNEFDRIARDLIDRLKPLADTAALVEARIPQGHLLALARMDSVRLGAATLYLIGGISVEERFLDRLARDTAVAVRLELPGDTIGVSSSGGLVREIAIPYIADIPSAAVGEADGVAAAPATARLVFSHSLAPLRDLRRRVDIWFAVAMAVTIVAAVGLAILVSGLLSRPIRVLASKTSQVDLDRLDVDFKTDRTDEVGSLSRLLGAMTERLRAGASQLRDAERRAAVGDLARQVNHDIKNGLTPIRNVVRHLTQLERDEPARLAAVFAERRGTLESSIAYLESLTASYAKLSPDTRARSCDVNEVARQVVSGLPHNPNVEVRTDLASDLPIANADPLVIRRIVENLVGNAIDSLDDKQGVVTVGTIRSSGSPDATAPVVQIAVADTGRGMSREELDRAFRDFYSTKPGGTGLGLSVVRRLVSDLGGSLRVDTEPSVGTTVVIDVPVAAGGRTRSA